MKRLTKIMVSVGLVITTIVVTYAQAPDFSESHRLPKAIEITDWLRNKTAQYDQEYRGTIYHEICDALQIKYNQWRRDLRTNYKQVPPITSLLQQVKDIICYEAVQLKPHKLISPEDLIYGR